MIVHHFTTARYRALREVAERRVYHWKGTDEEPKENWLVDGARVNSAAYDWLREKNLVTLDRAPLTGFSNQVLLSPRGVKELARQNLKAAKAAANAEKNRAMTETARRVNAERKQK